MDTRQVIALTLVSTLSFTIAPPTHARNCIKGKPCGKGCIALDKTCRIDSRTGAGDDTLRYDPGVKPGSIIHRTQHRLPTVHRVKARSVVTSESPLVHSGDGHRYTRGQRVFVYETYNDWARISNMQPEEWLELRFLEKPGE
jgi:hypothetical protein